MRSTFYQWTIPNIINMRRCFIVVGTAMIFWRKDVTSIQAAFSCPPRSPHRPVASSSTSSPISFRHHQGSSSKNFLSVALNLAAATDDDDEMAVNDEKIFTLTSTTDELLKELNDKFNYQGRMPMGSNRNSVDVPTTPSTNNMAATSPPSQATTITDFRCGFVVVLGAPNMGKSTLVNALLEQDLCITTARPQTTRHAILGILGTETCQVCLVDTPGVIDNPAYKLQHGMMEAVVGAFHDADVLLVVTDLFSTPIPNDALFAKVQASNKPVIIAVNKIDLVSAVNPNKSTDKQTTAVDIVEKTLTVEDAVSRWRKLLPNAMAIIPMTASTARSSVVNGDNVKKNMTAAAPNQQDVGVQALRRLLTGGPNVPQALRNLGRPIPGMFRDEENKSKPFGTFITDDEARALLPNSPPLYDQDILTDRPERFIASELIRAALFGTLTKELPYCCEVRIRSFKEPKTNENDNINDEHAKGSINKKKMKSVIRIEADVLVERDSQKKIVIGQKAEMIKLVGTLAREKLEDFFQSQVYLQLSVKVDKDWRRREDRLKKYGYLKS